MPSKCSRVDLPAPDGPMMEMNSPSLTSALTRRSTNVLVGPCSKYFSTFRKTIMGELIRYLYYAEPLPDPHGSVRTPKPSRDRKGAVSAESRRDSTTPGW